MKFLLLAFTLFLALISKGFSQNHPTLLISNNVKYSVKLKYADSGIVEQRITITNYNNEAIFVPDSFDVADNSYYLTPGKLYINVGLLDNMAGNAHIYQSEFTVRKLLPKDSITIIKHRKTNIKIHQIDFKCDYIESKEMKRKHRKRSSVKMKGYEYADRCRTIQFYNFCL